MANIDDDELAADWKAIQEKYAIEDEDTDTAPAGDAGGETVDDDGDTDPPEGSDSNRDPETGRFTPRGGKDGQGEQTQARQPRTPGAPAARGRPIPEGGQAPGQDGTRGAPGVDPAAARDISRAPSSWKPAERQGFEQLPESVRAAIHRREADFIRGQQQMVPDAQLGSSMRQAIEPYRMLIEAEGGTPERAVSDLLRTAAIFRVGTPEQKLQAVAGIAQQFGIDLRRLMQPPGQQGGAPGQQPQAPQQFRDPRVDQLLALREHENRQAQQREVQGLEHTVNSWMTQVDAQGNPKYPYLNDVVTEMASMLPGIRQANPTLTQAQALDEAYARATWANPEVRAILQQQAASASEAQRRADNQTRVAGARRAASVNVPRRGSIPAPGKPGRMEDTIAATARELGLISS